MRIKNARASFQRLMDRVLFGLQRTELLLYLEDIIVFFENLEEHDKIITRLFLRLRDGNPMLQPDKSKFMRTEVVYVGPVVRQEGVRLDPRKLSAIRDFHIPRTVRLVRAFLGVAGYYQSLADNFAKISSPLIDLCKNNTPIHWGQPLRSSLCKLRKSLCSSSILQ